MTARTAAPARELMVHGDCSSRGCYAMTDEQIQEIYALGRESFFGGQKSFQFQAYPFRMTALNMARHRNNPNFAFWKMLKEGYDHFEATKQEPKVAVCEKRYVFDADAAAKPFNPRGACARPISSTRPSRRPCSTIAATNSSRWRSYIAQGVATAPAHVGDGGMNPVFAQQMGSRQKALSFSSRRPPAHCRMCPIRQAPRSRGGRPPRSSRPQCRWRCECRSILPPNRSARRLRNRCSRCAARRPTTATS